MDNFETPEQIVAEERLAAEGIRQKRRLSPQMPKKRRKMRNRRRTQRKSPYPTAKAKRRNQW